MREGLEAGIVNDLDTNRTNVLLFKPQNLTCEYVTLAKGVQFLTPHPSRPNLTLMDRQPLYHRVHRAFTPTNLPPSNVALTGRRVRSAADGRVQAHHDRHPPQALAGNFSQSRSSAANAPADGH